MIAFISRLFTLFFILMSATFGLLVAIWGNPDEKTWEPLWRDSMIIFLLVVLLCLVFLCLAYSLQAG